MANLLATFLDRQFGLSHANTTIRRELLAGLTTFLTMSYIIFVNPVILGAAGMDQGAVLVATCLTAAICSVLIGVLANYPIAGAPGMGHNAFFAFTVCGVLGYRWQEALAAVTISGVLFMVLAMVHFRQMLVDAIPDSLKHAIAAGIGLLITLVGMEWAGLVRADAATLLRLGDLNTASVLIAAGGLLVMGVLAIRQSRAAILVGMLASLGLALALGVTAFDGLVTRPPSLAPTLLQMDFRGLLARGSGIYEVIFVFFITDVFDTVGTLVGVGTRAGLMEDGHLPRAERALFGDAVATSFAGMLGTSTVTAYVESASGVAAGGRTGLTATCTGVLMLLGIFFFPVVRMMSAPVSTLWAVTPTASFTFIQYPIVAPALIFVGSFMVAAMAAVPWSDPSESLPAFVTLVTIPLTFSITDGVGFGILVYVLMHLAGGRRRTARLNWLLYVVAVLFALRYLLLLR